METEEKLVTHHIRSYMSTYVHVYNANVHNTISIYTHTSEVCIGCFQSNGQIIYILNGFYITIKDPLSEIIMYTYVIITHISGQRAKPLHS